MNRIRNAAKNATWETPAVSVIVLGAVILAVYVSIVHFDFVLWDDDRNFVRNPWVRGILDASHWTWAFTTRLVNVYQPLSWLFLQAQYTLAPQNPASCIHTVSLILHIINSTIVFFLVLTFVEARKSTVALCGALYFALHPLQCETVAWASCQPYLLAACLGGLSLLCFQRALDFPENRGWYPASVLLFAASLLSKSSFVALPAVLVLLRVTKDDTKKFDFGNVFRDWFFWLLSFCAVGLAVWARPELPDGKAIPWLEFAKVAPAYLGFFVEKSMLPTMLSPIYAPSSATPWEILFGVLLVVATLICVVKPKFKKAGVLLLALLLLLLPGLAAARTEGILFADRFSYLPNGVMGLAISLAICRFQEIKQLSAVPSWLFAIFLATVLGVTSRFQLSAWSDSVRLWRHAIQNGAASSSIAHNNLAIALADRGETDEAVANYQMALEIDPDDAGAHFNLGVILLGLGQTGDAITHLQRAVQILPDYAEAHNDLGAALARRGQYDEAIAHYQKALEIKPDYAMAHNNLGTALANRGYVVEAIAQFKKALELQPDYENARRNLETVQGRGR